MARIRLTRKLSTTLNGVDLSRVTVGDLIDLPERVATMLVKEGWAEPTEEHPHQIRLSDADVE